VRARKLIEGASFGPEALKAITQAFDGAWVSVAANFGTDPTTSKKARLRLLRCCPFASEDSRDVEVLKQAAPEVMALGYKPQSHRNGSTSS
jgi:hypothetical protein